MRLRKISFEAIILEGKNRLMVTIQDNPDWYIDRLGNMLPLPSFRIDAALIIR